MLQKIREAIPWFLRIVLIFLIPIEWMDGSFLYVGAIVLALFLSFVPAIIARNAKAHLPWMVDFWVVFAVFLDTVGVVYDFYNDVNFWWWDKMTHFTGTIMIGIFAFYIIFLLIFVGKIYMSIPMVGLFIFVTSMAIGAIWEIGEFYTDTFLGTNTQISLANTMSDLQFDVLGGIVAALVGMWYSRRKRSLWWKEKIKK